MKNQHVQSKKYTDASLNEPVLFKANFSHRHKNLANELAEIDDLISSRCHRQEDGYVSYYKAEENPENSYFGIPFPLFFIIVCISSALFLYLS